MREWARKRREEDPDFRARNNQASRDHQRRKRQADPEAAYRYKRDHQLKSEFGISLDKYEEILDSQNGVCAICNQPQEKTLCVDHCHETDLIRGLLCDSCNNGLGRFKDDPELLASAIDYLSLNELELEEVDDCEHEWVDPSNNVVEAGDYRLCLKCHTFAIPEEE